MKIKIIAITVITIGLSYSSYLTYSNLQNLRREIATESTSTVDLTLGKINAVEFSKEARNIQLENDLISAQSEIRKLKEAATDRNQEAQIVNLAIDNLHATIKTSKAEIKKIQDQNTDEKQMNQALQLQVEGLLQRVDNSKAKIAKHQQTIKEEKQIGQFLATQIEGLNLRVSNIKGQRKNLEKQVQTSQDEKELYELIVDGLETRVTAIEKEKRALKSQIKGLKSQNSSLSSDLNDSLDEKKILELALKNLDARLLAVKIERKALQDQAKDSLDEKKFYEIQVEGLIRQVKNLKVNARALTSELEKKIADQDAVIQQLTNQVNCYKEEVSNLTQTSNQIANSNLALIDVMVKGYESDPTADQVVTLQSKKFTASDGGKSGDTSIAKAQNTDGNIKGNSVVAKIKNSDDSTETKTKDNDDSTETKTKDNDDSTETIVTKKKDDDKDGDTDENTETAETISEKLLTALIAMNFGSSSSLALPTLRSQERDQYLFHANNPNYWRDQLENQNKMFNSFIDSIGKSWNTLNQTSLYPTREDSFPSQYLRNDFFQLRSENDYWRKRALDPYQRNDFWATGTSATLPKLDDRLSLALRNGSYRTSMDRYGF